MVEALEPQEKSWGPVEPGSKQDKVWVDQAGIPRVRLGMDKVAITGTKNAPGGGSRNNI